MITTQLQTGWTLLAYLDPGTGSLVIQMLLAALLGCGLYWKKIKLGVTSLFSKRTASDPTTTPDDIDKKTEG